MRHRPEVQRRDISLVLQYCILWDKCRCVYIIPISKTWAYLGKTVWGKYLHWTYQNLHLFHKWVTVCISSLSTLEHCSRLTSLSLLLWAQRRGLCCLPSPSLHRHNPHCSWREEQSRPVASDMEQWFRMRLRGAVGGQKGKLTSCHSRLDRKCAWPKRTTAERERENTNVCRSMMHYNK